MQINGKECVWEGTNLPVMPAQLMQGGSYVTYEKNALIYFKEILNG